jgi:hypothetical protein
LRVLQPLDHRCDIRRSCYLGRGRRFCKLRCIGRRRRRRIRRLGAVSRRFWKG